MNHYVTQRHEVGRRHRALRSFTYSAGLVLCCVVCLFPAAARGQQQISYSPAAQTDAYGNARPVYQRIPLAVAPQQPVAQQGFHAYGWDAPSVNQRGAMGTLTLPTGLFARTIPQRPLRTGYRGSMVRRQLTQWRQGALARYGGFDPRPGGLAAVNFESMVERRYALMAATALNAPVYRSMLKPTAGLGVLPQRTAPGDLDLTRNFAPSGMTFDERLRLGVVLAHQRARSEAWQWFREDEFHRAARGFESAARLEALDVESRIGELFCHLSLGAIRTAIAVQRSLNARNLNPFMAELNLSEMYSNPDLARELGVESGLWGQDADRDADLLALHVLVLWYIGEHDEAIVTATSFARDFADTAYAEWPQMMRAARAMVTTEDDKP